MLESFRPDVLRRLEAYLYEALGERVSFNSCPGRKLPVFLQSAYAFTCGKVMGTDYVFVSPRDASPGRGTAWHAQQQEKLAGIFGRPVVLVLEELTARDRQRLVQRQAQFIVPFTQMYLPAAGADFREWLLSKSPALSRTDAVLFTPATQQVLLYALLKGGSREVSAEEFARELQISAMSVSRGLKDLETAGLITRTSRGRSRPARLTDEEPAVWECAQTRLSTPIQTRYAGKRIRLPGAPEAGLTALSRMSDLAAPSERTVAVSSAAWRKLSTDFDAEPLEAEPPERGDLIVEVWNYAPEHLAANGRVDPLSLYLSLRDDSDERVRLALDQMLEEVRLSWQQNR